LLKCNSAITEKEVVAPASEVYAFMVLVFFGDVSSAIRFPFGMRDPSHNITSKTNNPIGL